MCKVVVCHAVRANLVWLAIAGIPCALTECIFQSAIEHMNANVEKALDAACRII